MRTTKLLHSVTSVVFARQKVRNVTGADRCVVLKLWPYDFSKLMGGDLASGSSSAAEYIKPRLCWEWKFSPMWAWRWTKWAGQLAGTCRGHFNVLHGGPWSAAVSRLLSVPIWCVELELSSSRATATFGLNNDWMTGGRPEDSHVRKTKTAFRQAV